MPTDGYSMPLGTIAASESGEVFIPSQIFHVVIRAVRRTTDFTWAPWAGGLSQAAYQDGALAAARFRDPLSVAYGRDGALYVSDTGNFVVRRVDPVAKVVTTFAGIGGERGKESGKARFARFGLLDSVAFDPDGNAYVLDSKINRSVRWISRAGQVFTMVAGQREDAADGTGLAAGLHDARFLQAASDGTLYLVDRTGPGGTYYFKTIKPVPR